MQTPNVIVRPSVVKLEPTRVGVEYSGEHVLIHIGNSTLTLHYEDALKLSQWIRVRAKQAKRKVGDHSRHWSVIGVLDGLTE